ncbi:hypothetical protein [Alkalicoccobacillus murimartini]|uniref:WGR domain-containing protein n=1 Tax=Alkalicoccobacillus murimartini TaxID=171685 RepID=A0ABT9YM31_9BACI|nr:hypothetical protein [Alkalicoccobacillus murimartini]MDQ0208941.1 hypothetical protein [Alkalicoccobacillus murimartini]
MAAKSARVQVLHETAINKDKIGTNWVLCLQFCRYVYDNGDLQEGYRFIWRKPDGKLQAARGQARIPKLSDASKLMEKAQAEGWGELIGNDNKVDNT